MELCQDPDATLLTLSQDLVKAVGMSPWSLGQLV
jgi:hypothetical protein